MVASCISDALKARIAWAQDAPIAHILMAGHRWVRLQLVRYFTAERRSITSHESAMLAEKVGDLYFVIDAPVSAVRLYDQLVTSSFVSGEILCETADTLYLSGHTERAVELYRRAQGFRGFKLRGKDGEKMARVHEGIAPAYDRHHVQLIESLVQGRFSIASKQARERFSGTERPLWQARAEAAAGRPAEARRRYKQWFSQSDCSLNFIDWFCLPQQLWEAPQWWELLLGAVQKLSNVELPNVCDYRVLGGPQRSGDRAENWKAVFLMHFSRTTHDAKTMKLLSRRFPDWADCRDLLSWHHTHNTFPTIAEWMASPTTWPIQDDD